MQALGFGGGVAAVHPGAPESCDEVLGIFRSEGFADAAVVGEMVAGAPQVHVE